MSWFIWTQKVNYRRTLFPARPGPASELAQDSPSNSPRILFQSHTSFEASNAYSWRGICWHQSMWTIGELSSLPRTHFRTRPESSSELAQGHLLSLPRVPFQAHTGSSSDIKESKCVDHLYVHLPVAKQQYASNAGIVGPASHPRLTSYIPL